MLCCLLLFSCLSLLHLVSVYLFFFFFQAEDGIRDVAVTGVQTCALPIYIFLWGEDPQKGGYDANILKAGIALRAARATFAARRALEQGFTALRDLETEGAGYGDVEIKQAIEEGTIPGPRLFCATRAISTTGGGNPAADGAAPAMLQVAAPVAGP